MKILLAVSGGIDSIYMASRAEEFFPGSSFAVAHCNFHLRGDESDGDEEFVRRWAESNGLPFFKADFDTTEYASSNGVSIEMAARELRYRWFRDLCSAEGYDAVSVAHNANDNAETMMLNLLRGTGSRGLRGMSAGAVNENSEFPILRPMLDISRQEIEQWMKDNGKQWREDSTNSESICKRNIIRNEVFPLFKEINPSFLRTLARDMEHFAQSDAIADDYYKENIKGAEKNTPEGAVLNLKVLLTNRHWEYLLWRWLEPCRLSEETFGKLIALLKSERTISGKQFQSPTHTVVIHKKDITVKPR